MALTAGSGLRRQHLRQHRGPHFLLGPAWRMDEGGRRKEGGIRGPLVQSGPGARGPPAPLHGAWLTASHRCAKAYLLASSCRAASPGPDGMPPPPPPWAAGASQGDKEERRASQSGSRAVQTDLVKGGNNEEGGGEGGRPAWPSARPCDARGWPRGRGPPAAWREGEKGAMPGRMGQRELSRRGLRVGPEAGQKRQSNTEEAIANAGSAP